MRSYDDILMIAVERKGGFGAVLDGIEAPKTADELAQISGSDWLRAMCFGIMGTGISMKVLQAKEAEMTEAFYNFDVHRIAHMSEDWFYELLSDRRIIRNAPKVRALQENAAFIQRVEAEAGAFGRKIGDWPNEDYIGLLAWLKLEGSRLGGNTGPYVLRHMGKESFILTRDVVARLVAEGVVDKAPTSKTAMRAVQEAFNTWQAQSGQSLTTISRVLAQSVG